MKFRLQLARSKAMFTRHQIPLAPVREPYRIGLLLTDKNGDFGAISVT